MDDQGFRRVRKRINGRQPLPWKPCTGRLTEAPTHLAARSQLSSENATSSQMDTASIVTPLLLRCQSCTDGRKLVYTALVDGMKWKRLLCPSCKVPSKASIWLCNCGVPWTTCSIHRSRGFKLQTKTGDSHPPAPPRPKPTGTKVRKPATLGASAASIRKRDSSPSLYGRKPSSIAKRCKATASAPTDRAKAFSQPAPPIGATTEARALPTSNSVSTRDPPRPRVAVTAQVIPDGNTGVAALSRAQIAASPILQQYAQRGIIRMASSDAGSHQTGRPLHANCSSRSSKRRCTGQGVNTPTAKPSRKRKLSVGADPPPVKWHGNQHLSSNSLPRPPESGAR